MEILDEIRERTRDPRTASDDGCGIKGLEPLPPVSSETIVAAEHDLGFPIPRLLAEIYCTIANGGIGPGYGSFRIHDVPRTGDLVETYQYMRVVDPKDTAWQWPELLLPVFSHGCGIYECVDCATKECPVILHNPDYLIDRSVQSTLVPLSPTLEDRLRSWIRNEDLFPVAIQLLGRQNQ